MKIIGGRGSLRCIGLGVDVEVYGEQESVVEGKEEEQKSRRDSVKRDLKG